ncbi:hypothetical protein PIB30_084258 [Stylosanthes scabra]|uniref:Secreted protein n=1 Tax=Stylosanthes scabra TaxID=79078 RepID=A0ABU6WTQ1_9FABA|nr:hypothetical protein [Stylosanthes scabra]
MFRLPVCVRCHYVFAVPTSDSRHCFSAASSRFHLSGCFAFLLLLPLRVSTSTAMVGILLYKVRFQIKIILGDFMVLHSKGFYKALSPNSMKKLFKIRRGHAEVRNS